MKKKYVTIFYNSWKKLINTIDLIKHFGGVCDVK